MNDQDKLEVLWQERQITKTMLRFGRALDTGDWAGYAACFTGRVNIDFKRLTGFDEVRLDAVLWARFADLILSPLRRHHTLSNFNVNLEGDRAFALVYMTARHWKATDVGTNMNTQYGWYDVWLERDGEDWKISRLKHDYQWVEGNGALLENDDPEFKATVQRVFSSENMKAAVDYLRTVSDIRKGLNME